MAKTKTNDVRVIDGWSVTDKSEFNGVAHDTHFFVEQEHHPFNDEEWTKATLVIGDKAMPMSEVEAMLREAFRGYDRSGAGVSWDRMKQIAGEYGITP